MAFSWTLLTASNRAEGKEREARVFFFCLLPAYVSAMRKARSPYHWNSCWMVPFKVLPLPGFLHNTLPSLSLRVLTASSCSYFLGASTSPHGSCHLSTPLHVSLTSKSVYLLLLGCGLPLGSAWQQVRHKQVPHVGAGADAVTSWPSEDDNADLWCSQEKRRNCNRHSTHCMQGMFFMLVYVWFNLTLSPVCHLGTIMSSLTTMKWSLEL